MQHQQTFDDVHAVAAVSFLNRTQQKVLKLIAHQMTQSQIASRMKITRQYVNQIVSKLLKLGVLRKRGKSHWVVRFWRQSEVGVVTANRQLCNTRAEAEELAKKIAAHSVKPPEIEFQKCSSCYNVLYDVRDHLKKQVEQASPEVQVSTCRVHHIRLKYGYDIEGTVNTGRKTGYVKSWKMRGGMRHKFQVQSNRPGYPDIIIDVHPNTIVAYPDSGQTMVAETIDEIENVTKEAISEGVTKFIGVQKQHGVRIERHRPMETGKLITDPHYAHLFSMSAPHATTQTQLPGRWIDASPQAHGMPGYLEIETLNKADATALDIGIYKIQNLDSILARDIPPILNDTLERTLSPLFRTIETLQQTVTNLTQMLMLQ